MAFKIGDKVQISPDITGTNQWLDGQVTDVENNPFNGVVVSAKALVNGIIYFNRSQYFRAM